MCCDVFINTFSSNGIHWTAVPEVAIVKPVKESLCKLRIGELQYEVAVLDASTTKLVCNFIDYFTSSFASLEEISSMISEDIFLKIVSAESPMCLSNISLRNSLL